MQTSGKTCREIAAAHSVVVLRAGGGPSIPEAAVIESMSRGVLDPPPARRMTVVGLVWQSWEGPRQVSERPHNSRAFENANDDTRRVFSSKISVRVIGGSARWLQFSRSQSRQLTPIGVPSAFSRSIPAA